MVPLQSNIYSSSGTTCTIFFFKFLKINPLILLTMCSLCHPAFYFIFYYSCSFSRKLPLALLTITTTKPDKTFDTFQAVLNELLCFVNTEATIELNFLLVLPGEWNYWGIYHLRAAVVLQWVFGPPS